MSRKKSAREPIRTGTTPSASSSSSRCYTGTCDRFIIGAACRSAAGYVGMVRAGFMQAASRRAGVSVPSPDCCVVGSPLRGAFRASGNTAIPGADGPILSRWWPADLTAASGGGIHSGADVMIGSDEDSRRLSPIIAGD